ncbi:MAG: hypothetical protein ACLFUU_12450 [Desulfobacteraceae bacterium]
MVMPKLDFEAVENFQTAGASKKLAQEIVRYVSDKLAAQVVNKADLIETREALRSDIAGLRVEMATKAELAGLRTELVETKEALRAEMTQLATKNGLVETRETLRKEMSDIQTSLIKWMIGTALGSAALVTAILGATILRLIK